MPPPDSPKAQELAALSSDAFVSLLQETEQKENIAWNPREDARVHARMLLLAIGIPSTEAQKLVDQHFDALAASYRERLKDEGDRVLQEYKAFVSSTEEGSPKALLLALQNDKEKKFAFTDGERETLETILGHFSMPKDADTSYIGDEKQEDGYFRYTGRIALNGRMAVEDYEKTRQMVYPAESPEAAYLTAIHECFRTLHRGRDGNGIDPLNYSFTIRRTEMRPGTRFFFVALLAGVALVSTLMSRRSGKPSLKAIAALGLIAYLCRQRNSPIAFVNTPRYNEVTQGLRGTAEGEAIIGLLHSEEGQLAVSNLLKNRNRTVLRPMQLSHGDPKQIFLDELDIKDIAADETKGIKGSAMRSKLEAMEVQDIIDLGNMVKGLSDGYLDTLKVLIRRDVLPRDAAKLSRSIEAPETQ